MKTIVKILHGSHLYGTNTPNSDTDYKTIYLPDAKELILQKAKLNKRDTTGKPHEKNTKDDIDQGFFSLSMYMDLLAEGQTMALDLLFAPDSHILETSPLWEHIRQNRYRLVHKNMTAFVGYCQTQAAKYGIKGSRMAAVKSAIVTLQGLDPASRMFESWDKLKESLGDVEHVGFPSKPAKKDSTTVVDYFEVCNRLFDRTCRVDYVLDALHKIYNNYGARAKLAMTNEGVDWKALSHAVRVCVQGIELLNTGNMTLPLPPNERTLVTAIKKGLMPYSEVSKIIESYVEQVEQSKAVSVLNEEMDMEWCSELVASAYLMHMNTNYDPSISDMNTVMWLMELKDENI